MVATQLRLLPQSPKILIIPALSTALPSPSAEPFEPLRWVRYVHHAYVARSETARAFLQSSTSMQPRLVFLNGGTVSARVECIQRIAEQMTNGNIDEADAILDDLVKDGLSGLLRSDHVAEEVMGSSVKSEGSVYSVEDKDEHPPDYRGAIAMEAAEDLDSQTVDLLSPSSRMFSQSSVEDSESLHYYGGEQNQSRQNDQEECLNMYAGDIKKTIIILPDGISDQHTPIPPSKRDTFGTLPATTYIPDPPQSSLSQESIHEIEGEGDESEDLLSFGDRSALIEVGHAKVIRLESNTPTRNMKFVTSVDRFTQCVIESRRRSRSMTPRLVSASALAHHMAALNCDGHRRRASLSDLEASEPASVRAFSTSIKKASVKSSANSSPRRVYVDRGTDAGPILDVDAEPFATPDTVSSKDHDESPPFEPVFPIFEDLVIHFADGADNSVLESVVRSYKNGIHPVIPQSGTGFASRGSSRSNSPKVVDSQAAGPLHSLFCSTTEYEDSENQGMQTSNSCISQDSRPGSRQGRFPFKKGVSIETPSVISPAPLSPAATPPTKISVAQRFHRVSSTDNIRTATGIQNALRAVLNLHFPPELTNYRQYFVPVDSDRLWKPVFRDSAGYSQEGRTVDQIIAIGAEDGVNSNFFNEIAGRVERLGSKKNGTTRSGKLDMRFLIASAMQTFTKQSLLYQSQSSSSPFSSPMLLASLLIPQLETYLANNVSTRLLIIHYSASHLPTILALRHLVGAEIFKIAAILNSLSVDPLLNSFPSLPLGGQFGNRLSNANVAAYNSRTRTASRTRVSSSHSPKSSKSHSPTQSIEFKYNSSEPLGTSFSRSDYLLQSIGSDVEIAAFLSSITNHLIEKSSYYTPEPNSQTSRMRSPVSPTFTSLSNNTSSAYRKSGTPNISNSNSSPPVTPPGREKENIIGQPINSNITRSPHKNLDDYSNPSAKKGLAGDSERTGVRAVTPSTYLIPKSTFQAFPASPTSTHNFNSPISITPNQNAPSAPITTATVFNSNPPNIQRNTISHQTQTSFSRSRSNMGGASIITALATRPTTAEARERQSERDWDNFYIGDSDEEDEIDRLLMPRVPRRVDRRKGNSRKALKWLGLA